MAGENKVLDDIELDLDIETITLDDIDIDEIDSLEDSSQAQVDASELSAISLEEYSPEEQQKSPNSTNLSATKPVVKIQHKETLVTTSEPAPETTAPGAPKNTESTLEATISEPVLEEENIGTMETLNIIEDTPEPAIVEEQEIKPVEEIRNESSDATFNTDQALEEAYIFDTDDEIISIDGSELDAVIYGEVDTIEKIKLIDEPEEQNKPTEEETTNETSDDLMEVSEVAPQTVQSETETPVVIEEDENYQLKVENNAAAPSTSTEPELNIQETPREELELPDIDLEKAGSESDGDEPIALSMEELNNIAVSDNVEELPQSELESPLNADKFNPAAAEPTPPVSETPEKEETQATEEEELSIPETPLDITEETLNEAPARTSTDIEELYSIYSKEESPLESGEVVFEDLSGEEKAPVEESETATVPTENEESPVTSTKTVAIEEVEPVLTPEKTVQSEEETASFSEENEKIIVPSSEGFIEDESLIVEPFETEEEAAPVIETLEHEEPIVVEMNEQELEISEEPSAISEFQEEKPENTPTEEITPLEEEIVITQNDFENIAKIEEKEENTTIENNDLKAIEIEEPILEESAPAPITEAPIPGFDEEQDQYGDEIILFEGTEETTEEQRVSTENNESQIEEAKSEEIAPPEEDELQIETIPTEIIPENEPEEISGDNTLAEMDQEEIIASAPDATPMETDEILPVPEEITLSEEPEETEHVEIAVDELDELQSSFKEETVSPEMYGLSSGESSEPTVEKEQIISDKISPLSADTKEELKKVLSYLDNLLEDLPSDKIEEFSKSEYYDLYVKILDKLGV